MSAEKRPVAILQHEGDAGPGYFEDWLREHRIAYRLLRIDEGEPVPESPDEYAGICSLGGSMGVNEPLPWIGPELALLRGAVAAGVPVLGHCLGGQLLACALGAPVTVNPVREIGWGKVAIMQPQLAREWLGATPAEIEIFQWHRDTFALPPRATNFLASRWCENQAFILEHAGVAHVGVQFHCEVTAEIVRTWSGGDTWHGETRNERSATVGPAEQDANAMLEDVEARCAAMHVLAARLYARWWRGAALRAGTEHAAHAIR